MIPRLVTMSAYRVRLWLGILLLAAGLGGHLLAAAAQGGRWIHYWHHILGFLFLTAVAWLILALPARRFWRGRHDITVLALGAVQTMLGILVYSSTRVATV
jgi:hypothetical protein